MLQYSMKIHKRQANITIIHCISESLVAELYCIDLSNIM